MAEHEKRAKRYPTDLTDAEWEIVRPFLPTPPKRGRNPTTDLREVLNALRYLARSGGGWRMLPKDLPPGNSGDRTGNSGDRNSPYYLK
ncbi:transposase [Sandaracinobacteroides hominis]|uniref:transposase n=1 Tax=Sandaracinobacteroides hominis TaxID=2780086 RepID=UPI0018F3B4D2|nr:transposase [Sandaracinobacteroides hominis]